MLGTERTEGVYEMLWANLTQLPMSDGLVHVAELVMARQLPMMVHLHQLFSSSVTRLPEPSIDLQQIPCQVHMERDSFSQFRVPSHQVSNPMPFANLVSSCRSPS